jgi:hypothetical protein
VLAHLCPAQRHVWSFMNSATMQPAADVKAALVDAIDGFGPGRLVADCFARLAAQSRKLHLAFDDATQVLKAEQVFQSAAYRQFCLVCGCNKSRKQRLVQFWQLHLRRSADAYRLKKSEQQVRIELSLRTLRSMQPSCHEREAASVASSPVRTHALPDTLAEPMHSCGCNTMSVYAR